jgi:hypothetical protein
MPQIIVAADRGAAFGQGVVTLREGVTVADFESEHFASQLVERLGWAVEDADQLERTPGDAENTAEEPEPARQQGGEGREPEWVHREPRVHRERGELHNGHWERAEDREPVTAR